MQHRYLIGLGGNRRHGVYGGPVKVLVAASSHVGALGRVEAFSSISTSAPLGPSRRVFANAALLLASDLSPPALLDELKRIERAFGRRRGQRWGERVLDLDILLWSGGKWRGGARARRLVIPHPRFRDRAFALGPAAAIAPGWRDPATGLTLRQLRHRLVRRSAGPESTPSLTLR